MALTKNEDAFAIQKMMLLLAGTWPKERTNVFNKFQAFMSFGMLVTVTSSLFLGVLVKTEFSDLIQCWTMFISLLNCCMKFGIFYLKIPTLRRLLKLLRTQHFSYYDADLDIYVSRATRTATITVKLFLISVIFTTLSLILAPVANLQARKLPLPFPVDFKDKHILSYILVFIYQSAALCVSGWTSTGFDNVFTSMMGLSAAYFKVLKLSIMRITDTKSLKNESYATKKNVEFYGKFDNVIHDRLAKCVSHHLAVIRFAEYVESIFTYIVLFQFLASAVGICLAGFTFTSAPVGSHEFVFALSLPITLMFQISLYCTFGNEVTIQSTQIGDACYQTEWRKCGPRVRRSLFLIMERSKRPLVLTAGKFITLSLVSLVAVLRSAVSYVAVLRQLTNKE